MNSYELMVIFTPVLSQEEYKAEAKQIVKSLTDAGGKVVAEDFWGLKQLAYPIEKKTTALYYILEFQSNPEIIERMLILLNRTESIMRQMVTSLDKHAVAYNARRRSGVSAKASTKNETTLETKTVENE